MQTAPITAIFVKAYNNILRALQEKGYCINLTEKPINSAVTQDELGVLRQATKALMSRSLKFEVEYEYNSDNQAINASPLTPFRKINGGHNFLIMPATHNTEAVYENPDPDNLNISNSFSSQTPILFDHFHDIISNLNSIDNLALYDNYRISEIATNGMIKSKEMPTSTYSTFPCPGIPSSNMGGNYSQANAHWFDFGADSSYYNQILYYDCAFHATSTEDTAGTAENRRIMVFNKHRNSDGHSYVVDGKMQPHTIYNCTAEWEECTYPTTKTFSEPIDSIEVSEPGTYEEYTKSIDHSITSTIVVEYVSFKIDDISDVENDHPENGILECGCPSANFEKPRVLSDTEIRYDLGSGNMVDGVRTILYLTNIFVAASMDGYFTNINTVGMYSLPTVHNFHDASGNDISMVLAILRRPNGAYAPVIWSSNSPLDGEPINGGGYRVENTASGCVAYFSDKVFHTFDTEGNFTGAYYNAGERIIRGTYSGISMSSSSNPLYEIASVTQGVSHIYYSFSGNVTSVSKILSSPSAASAQSGLYSGKTSISGSRSFMSYKSYSGSVTEGVLVAVSGGSISGGAASASASADSGQSTATTTVNSPGGGAYSTTESDFFYIDGKTWNNTVTTTTAGGSATVTKVLIKIGGQTLPLSVTIGERTTSYGYYDNGKLKYRLNPDGSWAYFYYDANKRLQKQVVPFGNVQLVVSSGTVVAPVESNCRVTELSYAPVFTETVVTGDDKPRRVIEKVRGTEVGRRYHYYNTNLYQEIVCTSASAGPGTGSGNLITTYSAYNSGVYSGRNWKTDYPDGTASINTYVSSGGYLYTSAAHGVAVSGAIVSGTCTVTKTNEAGNVLERKVVDVPTGLVLDSQTHTYYLGRPVTTTYMDGSVESTTYACCGPLSVIHRDGSVTEYRYNPDKSLAAEIYDGVITSHSYNAAGKRVETRVGSAVWVASANSYTFGYPQALTIYEYDTNNELARTKVAIPVIASSGQQLTAEDFAITSQTAVSSGGYWCRTIVNPDGGTVLETYNTDGTLAFRSGTAVETEVFSHMLVSSRLCDQTTVLYGSTDSATIQRHIDFGGRQFKTVLPNNSVISSVFDSAGRVSAVTDQFGTVTKNLYNAKGELWKTCIVMSGTAGFGPVDRITEIVRTTSAHATVPTVGVTVETTLEYNDGATSGTAVKAVAVCNLDNSQKITENGVTTTVRRTYYNTASEKGVGEIITNPDSSTVTNSYVAGNLESSEHSVLGITSYTYDALNRLATVSKLDGGTTVATGGTTVTTAYTYDGRGNAVTETTTFNGSHARVISRTFDVMNRMTVETRPGNRTVTRQFNQKGEIIHVDGYGVYEQAFTYERGMVKTLTTYQNAETPTTTTWFYNAVGQLTTKQYADGSTVEYTYTNNRPTLRVWGYSGIATTYTYNNAGQITSKSYNEGTPSVSYGYNRRGQLTSATDVGGSRSFTYDATNNMLKTETLPYYSGRTVYHNYDSLNRVSSVKVGTSQTNTMYEVTYTYDEMSRLNTVTGLGKTATYSRLANSNRLNSVSFGVAAPTSTYGYDEQLRLVHKGGWTRFLNAKDEATDIMPDNDSFQSNYLQWFHSYDGKGQVTQSTLGIMAAEGPEGTSYTYSYDAIGNHVVDGVTINEVNQPSNLSFDRGNMTSDGVHNFSYDAENRLMMATGGMRGYKFEYDYAGRCFRRITGSDDGCGGFNETGSEYYIYNGAKKIAVLNVGFDEKYVWQPASSGDASVILFDAVAAYATDANKNVTAYYIPPEWPGQPDGRYYTYSPFGEPHNGAERFAFSSEEWLPDYGLILYLYRAYSPSLKRFLTRDPIGERGGVNLYGFAKNNPVTLHDFLGFAFSKRDAYTEISLFQQIALNLCTTLAMDTREDRSKQYCYRLCLYLNCLKESMEKDESIADYKEALGTVVNSINDALGYYDTKTYRNFRNTYDNLVDTLSQPDIYTISDELGEVGLLLDTADEYAGLIGKANDIAELSRKIMAREDELVIALSAAAIALDAAPLIRDAILFYKDAYETIIKELSTLPLFSERASLYRAMVEEHFKAMAADPEPNTCRCKTIIELLEAGVTMRDPCGEKYLKRGDWE